MNAFIAQFLVWVRIVVSPTVVIAAWNATRDGKITSAEVAAVVQSMDFEIKVPFVQWFQTGK
jgi:hypothetical protein